MSHTTLFHSLELPGTVMNRFGVVLCLGRMQSVAIRDLVRSEARAAGWTIKPSMNPDTGMIYCPTDAPDDGKGEQ
jgi:hypothetical protein